jgi:hypothetical protein
LFELTFSDTTLTTEEGCHICYDGRDKKSRTSPGHHEYLRREGLLIIAEWQCNGSTMFGLASVLPGNDKDPDSNLVSENFSGQFFQFVYFSLYKCQYITFSWE